MTNMQANRLTTTSSHPIPMDAITTASMTYCRDVTKKHARNFYYGMKLTPGIKRDALYAIYAFMRACDDLVDQDPTQLTVDMGTPQEMGHRIELFRSKMQAVIDTGNIAEADHKPNSIWPAFNHVMKHYPVDPKYLHDMLDGQRRDLGIETFTTFEQLYDYCFNVASVVGLTCISIWGYNGGKDTQLLAEKRGIAFQLTNILRDLHEDSQRGRVYLPAQELAQFDVDPKVFATGEADAKFDRLMQFQVERAYSYYEDSEKLESHLNPDCQSTCWAMMRIYRGLLEKIADNPRRVLTERVRLTKFQKTAIAMRAKFRKPQS